MTAGPCSTDKPPALEPCTETACPPGGGHVSEHEGGLGSGEDWFQWPPSQMERTVLLEGCGTRSPSINRNRAQGPPGSRLPLVSGPRGPGACWKVSSSLLCRETLPLSCPASGGLRLGADASRRRGWPALFP